jgi:hypothetical protein
MMHTVDEVTCDVGKRAMLTRPVNRLLATSAGSPASRV